MSKSVMISIQPKWCELIASGKKTVEVRKTAPKIATPFKVYIYCSGKDYDKVFYIDKFMHKVFLNGNGKQKVIGEFICDELTGGFWISPFSDYLQRQSCLSYDEVCDYANGKPIFAWHISNLVIYDKPKELSEFYISDNDAIQSCKHREIVGQPEYKTAHNGWIKGSYICNKNEPDWCTKCKTKPITRPPQSWCYVEENANE